MNSSIRLIYKRFSHHASHSGYDQLAKYVGRPLWRPLRGLPRLMRLCRIDQYLTRRSGMRWYNGLHGELAAAVDMLWPGRRTYHFLYGENGYRYLRTVPWSRRHKVLCTFHVPPGLFTEVMPDVEHLNHLDAVIIVGRNQWDMLASIVGQDRVYFVPLGVDTHAFHPGDTLPGNRRRLCLCVGHHLRDVITFCEVARIVGRHVPDVRFVLVDDLFYRDRYLDARGLANQFEAIPGLELRTGLSEADLIRMYQTSDLLVLPLLDATANTSLLEAIACGLPPVVSDVGGVSDYVDETCAVLVSPQDAEMMATEVLQLLDDESRRQSLALQSRRRAQQLDWSVIADQTKQVYRQVWSS